MARSGSWSFCPLVRRASVRAFSASRCGESIISTLWRLDGVLAGSQINWWGELARPSYMDSFGMVVKSEED